MKTTGLMVRQGDVLLEQLESMPADAQKQEDESRIVLALGEATGHAHAISTKTATRYQWNGDMLIEVDANGAELVHEEHATIPLAPGVYRKVQQREYTPEAIRNVAD